MMSCVYFKVPTTIRQASRSYCGLMLRGVPAILKDLKPTADVLGLIELFDLLHPVGLATLVEAATPQLWLNVRRMYALVSTPDSEDISAVSANLMTACYDSFWHLLPDQSLVDLHAGDPNVIVLPTIGVRLNRQHAQLGRVKDQPVIKLADSLVPLVDSDHIDWIRACPVSFSSARVIAEESPSLFDDYSLNAMKGHAIQPDQLADQLRSGFDLVQKVFPALAECLAKDIRWFVPLRSEDSSVHFSHTSFFLPGVIFLSSSNRASEMAEAMVHELGHNDLNSIENVCPLVQGVDVAQYYSPWRRDKRPLRGLLHALYVFSGVSAFLRALDESLEGKPQQRVRDRRTLILHRMHLALKQIPPQRLTDSGERLRMLILDCLEESSVGIEQSRASAPKVIEEHWLAWRMENPNLIATGPG